MPVCAPNRLSWVSSAATERLSLTRRALVPAVAVLAILAAGVYIWILLSGSLATLPETAASVTPYAGREAGTTMDVVRRPTDAGPEHNRAEQAESEPSQGALRRTIRGRVSSTSGNLLPGKISCFSDRGVVEVEYTGNYELSPPSESFMMVVKSVGFLPERAYIDMGARALVVRNWRLAVGQSFAVYVTNAQGEAIADAEAVSDDGVRYRSNAQGCVTFVVDPERGFSASIRSPGMIGRFVTFKPPINIDNGENVVLTPGADVRLKVSDWEGRAVSGAALKFVVRRDDGELYVRKRSTDADGVCTCVLPEGRLNVTVNEEGFAPKTLNDIEVMSQSPLDLGVVWLMKGREWTGVVSDGSRGVKGVRVRLFWLNGVHSDVVITDEDGRWVCWGVDEAPVELSANKIGYRNLETSWTGAVVEIEKLIGVDVLIDGPLHWSHANIGVLDADGSVLRMPSGALSLECHTEDRRVRVPVPASMVTARVFDGSTWWAGISRTADAGIEIPVRCVAERKRTVYGVPQGRIICFSLFDGIWVRFGSARRHRETVTVSTASNIHTLKLVVVDGQSRQERVFKLDGDVCSW